MVDVCYSKELPPLAVLRQSGWTLEVAIAGHSMEPLLKSGDRVTVACMSAASLQPGDLVCFKAESGFVLHRLLERRGPDAAWFYEKGDAESGGRWLDESRLIGRAIRINGRPLDGAAQARLLTASRAEAFCARAIRGLGLPRLPQPLAALWRKVKRRMLETGL